MEGLFRFFSEKERRMGEGTDKASTHDEGHDNNEAQYKQENETTVIVGRRRCVMFVFRRFFSNREKMNIPTPTNENTHSQCTANVIRNRKVCIWGGKHDVDKWSLYPNESNMIEPHLKEERWPSAMGLSSEQMLALKQINLPIKTPHSGSKIPLLWNIYHICICTYVPYIACGPRL